MSCDLLKKKTGIAAGPSASRTRRYLYRPGERCSFSVLHQGIKSISTYVYQLFMITGFKIDI